MDNLIHAEAAAFCSGGKSVRISLTIDSVEFGMDIPAVAIRIAE